MSPFLTKSGRKQFGSEHGNILKMVQFTELNLVRWPQAGKSSQTDLADEIKISRES